MSLEKAHSEIKAKFEKSLAIEPFSIVKSVDDHRNFWKPRQVNVLLLAESHVYTTTTDHNSIIEYDGFQQLSGCPSSYVRLVYCLGYGEKKLAKLVKDNRGTPQFWKIFASCINKDPHTEFEKISVTKNPYFTQRIRNKASLLEALKEKGIWLVDASIVALYDGIGKPAKKTRKKIIEISWEHHISKVVQEANPRKIIVIGEGVGEILEYKLNKIGVPFFVIPQPQGIRSHEGFEETYEKYYELCNGKGNLTHYQ